MITNQQLQGCHVAIITPMTRRGNLSVIDYDRLYELIDYCIEGGVSGLLFAGTTGQSATLSHAEQLELCSRGIDYARGRAQDVDRKITCIASAGSNDTEEALHLSHQIVNAVEPDALLHVTGYYNNPPQEGLIAHFQSIAHEMLKKDTGLILYNIPGRTGSCIEVETMLRLSEHPAIVAVKDATGDIESVQNIIDNTDTENFTVLSGEDHMVYEIIKRGGSGVISASANRWPKEFQQICNFALNGEMEAAENLQKELQPCIDAVFSAKNPIPLHYMLQTDLRLPLVSINDMNEENRIEALKLIEAAEAIKEFPSMKLANA